MKLLVSLFLIITISFSRDSYDLAKLKNATKYTANDNIHFFYLNGEKHLYTDFDLLAILSTHEIEKALENPNYSNKEDKEFLVLTEIFYYLIENTNLINNKATAIGLIIDNKMYAYDKLLVIEKNELNKIKNRNFNNIELSKAKKFNQIPPFYPFKNVLLKAKIFTAFKEGSGYNYTFNEVLTKNYQKFISNYTFRNHLHENYIEDAYNDYYDIQEKIHGYVSVGYIDKVEKYIHYNFDINKKDIENNQTLLDYAVVNGYYDIVNLLIKHGVDVNNFKKGYNSPYFSAERLGFYKISKLLKPLTKVTTRLNNDVINYIPSDLKKMCFGSGRCYSIENKDLKNSCFAITKSSSYAFNIKDKDLKNLAFGKSKDNSYCYNIKNEDLKNACFGISKNSSYCHSINNENLKEMCLGISKDKHNCYDIH